VNDLLAVGDVDGTGAHGFDGASQGAGFGQFILAPTGDDDLGAFAGKGESHCAPDASAAAGDEDDLLFEAHELISSCDEREMSCLPGSSAASWQVCYAWDNVQDRGVVG
jgi:hypothetical protein